MKGWQFYLMAGLFLVVFSNFGGAEAAPSPVSIEADCGDDCDLDIVSGEQLVITLTLDSSDTRYRKIDVYMTTNWVTGVAWSSSFVDVNGDALPDNVITIAKGSDATVQLLILCSSHYCSSGDINTLQIYAKTDPRWYYTDYDDDPENHTDTCGSDNCYEDTTPASQSINVTNTITFELTSYLNYSHSVVIDGFLMSGIACNGTATGDHLVYDSSSFITWNFTLNNTGYLDDFYTINWTLYYVEESEEVLVDLLSLNSLQSYPLVSGASTPGNNSFSDKINFSITNASLGNYTIFLVFNSGSIDNPATCIMDFQIVEAELIGWEGTGYNCSFTNTTFCDETREYCAEGVTNEDGATCASMIDTYCDGYGKDDSGCESWSSSKDINDCYAVTGREADDPFTKGYCDEFFAGQESISEDLSITLSRNMIIGLVITVLAIVSIYMMSRKETKI
tara:strand:- start:958 stop:2307 length:1350 start_codon:yes stop_codon:yes gene_type:complete